MENQSVHIDVQPDEISESFLCCICLDLLYKPIVLSCGHISCFWCVHKSMSGRRESHCPICRHAYNHFPNICLMLHLLLSKIYPIAYKMREKQILEEEMRTGYFSPQSVIQASKPLVDTECDHLGDATNSSTEGFESTSRGGSCENMEQLGSILQISNNGATISKQTSSGNVAVPENNFPENKLNGNCKQISIADVLCSACKQLLIRPVVLNCGHVYCETCIFKPTDEQLRCQLCQCLNPRGFPKVCLELDHFLEEQFCKEYALRRDTVQLKKIQLKHESAAMSGKTCSLLPSGENIRWWPTPLPKVHIGVGCDSCGMIPIIGERYRCKDCVEAIGFDLCGGCYNTSSKRPGRFNQQHTPEHRMELVKLNIVCDMRLRLVTGRSEDVSTPLAVADDVLEISSSVTLTIHDQESRRDG